MNGLDKSALMIYLIVLMLITALFIWGLISLVRWIKRVVEKQQEISMIKAQAMKTAADNRTGNNQPAQPRHYMSQSEYEQYKREHGIK